MKDHLGYISKIDTNRNFGFVKSDIDNNSYYRLTKLSRTLQIIINIVNHSLK